MFPSQTRFLVVDDSENIRELLKRELAGLGFSDLPAEAADATEALAVLESRVQSPRAIEVIISDWNMPGMNGLEFLKKVRSDGRFRGLPFLLVTSESNPEQVLEAAGAGVSNYIVKPFNSTTLGEKLEAIYRKHFGGAKA